MSYRIRSIGSSILYPGDFLHFVVHLFGSISTKREGGRRTPLLDIAIHYLFSVVTFVATKFLVFIS